jgi:hypothetical protein
MADVWDPIVEIRFDHTGEQSAGEEVVMPAYTLAPDEVLEIFRIEIIPPVDTTNKVVQKLRYVTLVIEGKDYESIKLNSIMAPLEDQYNLGVALNLGIPILHRPITGYMPNIIEAKCPKVARGQRLTVKTVADENITQPYSVILKCARVRGQSKLSEVVGPGFLYTTFWLDNDSYNKYVPPITLETFDELPGGLAQPKPQIFPWVTYARNKQNTTPNMWYDFEYDAYVKYQWQDLSFNLVNKDEAYLVEALGVIPHTNSKAIRLYIDGRITNPEFQTVADHNFFYPPMYYSTDTTAAMKKAGPVKLLKPFLFHGVKGGIQVIDNGTAIPANGVEVMVWGTKFVLK